MPEMLYRVDADWEDWLSEIWDEVDSIISESRLKWAVVDATNDTLKHMRSFLSREIRATYYVKKLILMRRYISKKPVKDAEISLEV